jgi:hypothetical protein
MIKKPIVYTIAAIALIGSIFFDNYKGELIPHGRLWLVLSIIVFFIAAYLAFKRKTKKQIARSSGDSDHRNKLIATGEQIKLDIDSCEIKENNYYEEIPDHNLGGTELIVAAFDPNENYEEKYIEQSAIIYHHKIGDTTEKYISQTFPFGTETLTLHILNNDIILYVDRFDRNNYLFDLNEKVT